MFDYNMFDYNVVLIMINYVTKLHTICTLIVVI